MADKWTYYQFDSLTGSHPTIYYRCWRGVTDRLDLRALRWIPVDPNYLSRYIENGEIGLDETTQSAIESTIGAPLPS